MRYYVICLDSGNVQKLPLLSLPKTNEESYIRIQHQNCNIKIKAENISKDIHDIRKKARMQEIERKKAKTNEQIYDLQKSFLNVEAKLLKHSKMVGNFQYNNK